MDEPLLGEKKVVKQSGKARLIIVDTTSDVREDNDTDVIVTGSHGGKVGGDYLFKLNVKGVISNDAGIGKNNAGIASLKILEEHGIPSATVSSMSSYIGNGTSTYEQGKISAVNEIASKLGIVVGMSAKEAADRMFEALIQETK